ncbi:MAG: phosphate signaling complex protein PhoU [Deltaproteobacteria bacterium]|nr:phosphate signaling complex protein PhoU [Deltaproteobacteria bacterium]
MRKHTDTQFDAGLRQLQDSLLHTGGLIEAMIGDAMAAVAERDPLTVPAILARDEEVDRLEIAIDAQCLNLLALHQPMASDLRLIIIALRANKDLERMGDLAVNIAHTAQDLLGAPPDTVPTALAAMATQVRQMVSDALNAFVRRDAALARTVCARDDEVDARNHALFEQMLQQMEQSPAAIRPATGVIAIAGHLERIADHATNLAEEVIFIVEGEDIRHRGA